MSNELKELFDYEYKGGGYFRKKGVPVGVTAPVLHGFEAVKYIYNKMALIAELKEAQE